MIYSDKKHDKKVLYLTASFLAVTFIVCLPLVFRGYLNGHDITAHVFWVQQFLQSFQNGILAPQWVPDAHLGCGSPAFIFYPPFIFYAHAFISFFTEEILTIVSVSAFLGMLVSGITMYVFSRLYFTRLSSLISSIAYMALPYHLIDLYIRSALAEFWAFVWIPLVCFCTTKIREKPVVFSAGLSFSFAGLLLTHPPTFLLFSLFLIPYIFFLLYHEGNRKSLLYRILSLILGFGLASFYLIPLIAEQQFINIGALTKDIWYQLKHNFLFSDGAGDIIFNRTISHIAISTALIPVFSLAMQIFSQKQSKRHQISHAYFFAIAGITSFFMTLSISNIFWEFLLLKQVQFPWRMLTITTFFASLSFCSIVENIFRCSVPAKKGVKAILILLFICLTGINTYYSCDTIRSFNYLPFDYVASLKKKNLNLRPDTSFEEMAHNFKQYYKTIPWAVWLMDALEYRPVWSLYNESVFAVLEKQTIDDRKAYYQGKSQKGIYELLQKNSTSVYNGLYEIHGSYIGFPPMERLFSVRRPEAAVLMPNEMLGKQAIFREGNGTIKVTAWEPEHRIIHVHTTEPGQILIKTFYYPRWKAYLHGKSIQTSPDPFTGLLYIESPVGTYDIELMFEASRYRLTGSIVSIISTGIILILILGRVFVKLR